MTWVLHPLAPIRAEDETDDVHDRARDVDRPGDGNETEGSESLLNGIFRTKCGIHSREQSASTEDESNNPQAYGGHAEALAGWSRNLRRRLHVGVGIARHGTGVDRCVSGVARQTGTGR